MTLQHEEISFEHPIPGIAGDVQVISPAQEQLGELQARAARHAEVADNLGVVLHSLPGEVGPHIEEFVVDANQNAEDMNTSVALEQAVIADVVAIKEIVDTPNMEVAAMLSLQLEEPLEQAIRETSVVDGEEAAKRVMGALDEADKNRAENPATNEVPMGSLADYLERQDRHRQLRSKVEDVFKSDTGDSIAGAPEFISQSMNGEKAMQTVLELTRDGVKPQDLIANGQYLIDAMKQLEEQGDRGKPGRDMLLGLLRCEGMQIFDESSALVDKLIEDPEGCRARVDLIMNRWHEVAESGCLPEVASSCIRGAFGKYSYQNRRREEGRSIEETLYDDCDRTFNAIDILGARGYEAKKRRPNGANDGYIGSLAMKMQHETFDDAAIADIRAKLEHFVSAYDGAAETSAVTVAMSESSDFGDMDIDSLGCFAQALEGTASREMKLKELSGESEENFHTSVYSTLHASYESLNRARHEGKEVDPSATTHSIDVAYDLHAQEPRYPLGIIWGVLRQQGTAADMESARLLNPNIITHLDKSERDRDEIMRAAAFIAHSEHDVNSLLHVYDEAQSPLKGILLEMGRAEPDDAQTRGVYYEMLLEEMQKLDKNGTPYSSPDSVANITRLMTQEGRGWSDIQQGVEWYRSDTLPLAAFETVTSVRERVIAKGIPDKPTAIYEYFCHSPELIAEMSAENLGQYASGVMKMDSGSRENPRVTSWATGRDMPAVIETAHAMAEDRKDAFRLFLNIKLEPLLAAAEQGGAIKSIMDTDIVDYDKMDERGASYVFHRSKVELMMGNRSRGESMHPVYGSCGYVDHGVPTGAMGYGDIMLSFKPESGDLASRTTYTPEDSFHGTARLTQKDAAALRIIKNAAGCDHMQTTDYIEAQISGGLDLSLVDAIYVPNAATMAELSRALPPEIAAKVQVQGASYDASAEQQAFAAQFGEVVAPNPTSKPPAYMELVGHAPSAPTVEALGNETYLDFM